MMDRSFEESFQAEYFQLSHIYNVNGLCNYPSELYKYLYVVNSRSINCNDKKFYIQLNIYIYDEFIWVNSKNMHINLSDCNRERLLFQGYFCAQGSRFNQ